MSAVPITVPSVGESISEGIVSRWLKADGSPVQAGEPLLELETDKATNVVPAPGSGVLKIGVAEGETVAIGATVGTIDPAGRRSRGCPRRGQAGRRPPERPGRRLPAARRPPPQGGQGAGDRPLSPSVRRLVAEQDVDVAGVAGTGPGGRITKGDVLGFLASRRRRRAGADRTRRRAASPGHALADGPRAPQARPRRPPRRRLARSIGRSPRDPPAHERTAPADRPAAGRGPADRGDPDHVQRSRHVPGHGAARPLQGAVPEGARRRRWASCRSSSRRRSRHSRRSPPSMPGSRATRSSIRTYYDIGVAVSTEKGLMVPVIRDADRLSFAAIEKAIAGYAAKAREGTIAVDDLRGGTFTITNGGIFGSMLSTPILNPPQSGILGMHAIKKRPVVVDDQIVIRPMMYLALSYDHRLIDGREAVSFLVRIKDCLENPERLMLEI